MARARSGRYRGRGGRTWIEQLRKSNLRLQIENSDLSRRLDSTQLLANAVLEEAETQALKEEGERLRQENEGLTKELEQLHADRCSDLEESIAEANYSL
ncbi:hypothetical protein LR48_Vigan08g144100 [Vigna angularis]|uniref:Uncharacterized protein n=1 Tax=Phaseolus angularis TaxID=3914 RepID=A0A0L9V7G2_PHAAN|nr:hypothetical protein LR48_Vigan08g144100 [Vigna angularis]